MASASPQASPPLAAAASGGEVGSKRPPKGKITADEERAGHQPRRCTDVVCIPLFISSWVLLAYILYYARVHGDLARVFHGIDFHNQLCGATPAVKDKPLLFWCTTPGAAIMEKMVNGTGGGATGAASTIFALSHMLDVAHPICVQSCPTGHNTTSKCFQKEIIEDGEADATGTFSRNTTFVYDFIEDYPTKAIAGRYCFPQSEALVSQLRQTFGKGIEGAMFHFQMVFQRWPTLLCSSFLAFILGYAYLFLVKTLARPLIMFSFLISSLSATIFGCWILVGVFHQGLDDAFTKHLGINSTDVDKFLHEHTNKTTDDFFVPSTGWKPADITISILLLLLGLAIPIIYCCAKHSIDLVVGCLGAVLECLEDMPLLLLHPLVSVILKVVYMGAAAFGLAFVVSVGEVKHYSLSDRVPAGVTRSFKFSESEYWYLFGYIFISAWLYEFGAALEQFVFIYATQMWFFAEYSKESVMKRKKVSQLSIMRGLFVGLTYHFGTLAFGSLILAIFKLLYAMLSIVYNQAKKEAGDDAAANKVVEATVGCCMCCLKCWEEIVRYLNKMVYIVVTVDSENFCTAAKTMLEVTAAEVGALALLEGATKFFQVGGILSISSIGAYLTWLTLRNVDAFKNPESAHFVPQPEYVTAAAGVLAAMIAGVFMNVFDVVSDTLLFCWALDKKRRQENGLPPNENLPEALQALVGADEKKPEEKKPLIDNKGK